MLAPQPPVPVARRRATAAMVVAHRQAAPIGVGHVLEIPARAGVGAAVPTQPGAERPRAEDDGVAGPG